MQLEPPTPTLRAHPHLASATATLHASLRASRREKTTAPTPPSPLEAAKPPAPDQYVVNHPYIAPMDMDALPALGKGQLESPLTGHSKCHIF